MALNHHSLLLLVPYTQYSVLTATGGVADNEHGLTSSSCSVCPIPIFFKIRA